MRNALFFFIFMLMCSLCYAGAKPPKPVLVKDTDIVVQRHLDNTALSAYKKQPAFQYHDNYDGPSLWTRFWRWFWDLFNFKRKTTDTALGWFWTILKYALVIGGVASLVFLILKSAGIDVLNLLRRKPMAAPVAYSEFAENIHEIDFDAEIEKAVAVHNYRMAVRLLYLRALKQLSDTGLINWQINKTNTQYTHELANTAQHEPFKLITRQFEYVWYGDFLINGDIYKKINGLFHNFKIDPK